MTKNNNKNLLIDMRFKSINNEVENLKEGIVNLYDYGEYNEKNIADLCESIDEMENKLFTLESAVISILKHLNGIESLTDETIDNMVEMEGL